MLTSNDSNRPAIPCGTCGRLLTKHWVADVAALERTLARLQAIRGVSRSRTTVVLSTRWEARAQPVVGDPVTAGAVPLAGRDCGPDDGSMAGAPYRGPVSTSHPEPEPAPPPDDADVAQAQPVASSAQAHAFLLYNIARLGILVVAFGVFYVVGFRGIALLIVAFLVSGAVSYLALYRLRGDAVSGVVSAYWRINDRIDARSRREDDDD